MRRTRTRKATTRAPQLLGPQLVLQRLLLLILVVCAVLPAPVRSAPNGNSTSSSSNNNSTSSPVIRCPKSSTPPLVLRGKRFYDSLTGSYVALRGIAYHPRPNDGPLSVSNSVDMYTEEFRIRWTEDVTNLKALNVNAIRIYAVDPSKNHDAFFCALQEAGIYVLLELLADCEECNIGGATVEAATPPACYPLELKKRGRYIINEFSKYDNVVAFSAGNEVSLYSPDQDMNSPCQKKFLRDMRAYVDACASAEGSTLLRRVPIGLVNWDGDRTASQILYYACRTDPADVFESVEWIGINAYRHCDPKAVTVDDLTGWQDLKGEFEGYDLAVPVLVAEYGCRERGFPTIDGFEAQRTWLQVDALYSPPYQEVFAGGMVFEYSAEKKIVDASGQGKPWPYEEFMKLNYGVGYLTPVDCDHQDVPCTYEPYPEFALLSDRLAVVNVSYVPPLDVSKNGTQPTGAIPHSVTLSGRRTRRMRTAAKTRRRGLGCGPVGLRTCPQRPRPVTTTQQLQRRPKGTGSRRLPGALPGPRRRGRRRRRGRLPGRLPGPRRSLLLQSSAPTIQHARPRT